MSTLVQYPTYPPFEMDHPSLQHSPRPAPSSTPLEDPSPAASNNSNNSGDFHCLWETCTRAFVDAETLYNHLCNEHIGRKSTNNLCLTCKWKDCGTTCAKRDHITSHLRVHTPLKPHACEVCSKSFKRPQDLKKHEKIHTEEHHQAHKHSKAITVQDPAYSARVRGPEAKSTRDTSTAPSRLAPLARSQRDHDDNHSPMYPAWETADNRRSAGRKRPFEENPIDELFSDAKRKRLDASYDEQMASRLTSIANLTSLNSTISDQTAVAAQISLAALAILQGVGNPLSNLSTPALSASSTSSLSPPNLNASIQNLHSSSAVNGDARSGGAPSRHSPSASSTAHGNGSNGRFIPTSVSLPIHSPEELEAVNAFLLQLGRNVTGTNSNGTHSQSQSHLHPHSASTNHSSHGQPPRMQVNTQHLQTAPTENWFDPATLAQLGLAGLPGLPSAPSSDHQYSHSPNNYNSANVSRDYAALLRQLHLPDLSANATHHDNSMNHRPAYEYTHGRTPPPATLSPVSSSGSSHGHSFSHGGSGLPPHRLSPGSLYDHPVSASFPSHRHSDTQLKTSFGGSLRRNSAGHGSTSSGGILEHPGGVHGLAAPTLGQREGAGLLGSGVKGSLLLQASAKRFAAVQKVHEVTKEEEVEIDELADDSDEAVFAPAKEVPLVDVSVADDEEDKEERMSVDAPSPRAESVTMEDPDSPHFAPAASLAIDGGEEEEESRSTTPDSVASVHKPGHSLYPLLHEEGDPKFKLPALALGHHHHHHHPHQNGGLYADLTRALPSAGYRFDMSSTRSTSAMTEGTEVSSSAASTATATPRSRSPPPLSPPTSPSPRSSSRVVLPSLASVIAETTPAPSSIPASTAKSKVPEEERKRHALLIRNLLIFVNLEYMKQFGADAVARLKLRTSSSSVRSRSMTMEPSDEEEDGGEEELSGGEMELESPRVAVTAC